MSSQAGLETQSYGMIIQRNKRTMTTLCTVQDKLSFHDVEIHNQDQKINVPSLHTYLCEGSS